MIVSLIITLFLLYIIHNTKIEGQKPQWYIYVMIAALGLSCSIASIILLLIVIGFLYKVDEFGDLDTLSWIKDLFKRVRS